MNIVEINKDTLRTRRVAIESLATEMKAKEDIFAAEAAARRLEFEQSNAELISEFNQANNLLKTAESGLRESLIDWHKETGEKTFDKDLQVRVSQKLEYPEADAIAWSKENCKAAVVEAINRKAFEATAEVVGLPAFVTVKETFTTAIAKSFTS